MIVGTFRKREFSISSGFDNRDRRAANRILSPPKNRASEKRPKL